MVDQKTAPPPEPEESDAASAESDAPPPILSRLRVWADKLRVYWDRFDDFLWSREPHFWPTVTTAITVLLVMSLGFWQLARLQWKNEMLREIDARLHMPPIDMTASHPTKEIDWKNLEYRQVIIKGNWLSLHGFKMMPRTYEGQVGYHLILPMRLAGNQIIFVNRGFVPETAAILPPPEEKVFAVQGVLKIPEDHKKWAIPENVPSKGVWTWTDLAAMRHEIGVNSAAPMILYETRVEAQETYPIGGQLPVPVYNRHRQYALIWFALAIAFMGIWMIASKPKEKLKPAEENTAANDDDRLNDPVARRNLYPEATD